MSRVGSVVQVDGWIDAAGWRRWNRVNVAVLISNAMILIRAFHSIDSSILPWLGNVVVDHQGNDPDGQLSTASNGMPRSSSGNSITAVVGGGNGDSVSTLKITKAKEARLGER